MAKEKVKQFYASKNTKDAKVKKFYNFKNATDTSVDLYFYGDIVSDWWGAWQDEDQYPDAIKNFLTEANGKDLNIYINSGGGSVFAGIAIYNMLKRYPGKKTCHVDALAGSISSIFPFVDSEKPTIPSNAFLMIHKPWAGCEGNANAMRKMAEDLDAIETGIWNIYEENLAEGVTIETIKELMEKESWLNGNEAAQYFDIKVGEENLIAAAVQDYTKMYCTHTPKALLKEEQKEKPDEEEQTGADEEAEAAAVQAMRNQITEFTISHMGL